MRRTSWLWATLIIGCGGSSTPDKTDDEAKIPDILASGQDVASHPDCGGKRAAVVDSGHDDDGNGTLDAAEIDTTTVVCSNDASCAVTEDDEKIVVECPNHPLVVVTKPEQPEPEILETGYVVVVGDAGVPAPCPRGGYLIQAGLDNGPGAGEAGNGTLEPSEIDASTPLCNPYCGDGSPDAALLEECDDGDNVSNDGCSADCREEASCLPPTPDPGCPAVDYFVNQVNPGIGPTGSTTLVTLTGAFPVGTALANTTVEVTPGGMATVLSASETEVTFTMPAGNITTLIDLVIFGDDVPFLSHDFGPDGAALFAVNGDGSFLRQAPTVSAAHGCTDGGSGTSDCPLAGSIEMTLTGTNFGASAGDVEVSIGGVPCSSVAMTATPDTELTCTLGAAPALAYDLPVEVIVAGRAGVSDPLVSYQVPVITPNSLHLVGDAATDDLLLADIGPHQLALDFTGASGPVEVLFGTPDHLFIATGEDNTTPGSVIFDTAAATGVDLRFVIDDNGVRSRPSHDRLSFPAPAFQDGTLRTTLGGGGTPALILAGSFGDTLFFDVDNLVDSLPVSVSIGPYPCNSVQLHPASGTLQTVECKTTLGTGIDLIVEVTTMGQTGWSSTGAVSYPLAPEITEVNGCNLEGGCPTAGGGTLEISGPFFTTEAIVTVGGHVCQEQIRTSGTHLTCVAPPGVGLVDLVVHEGSTLSSPIGVAYARPSIHSISGCDDAGTTTENCPTGGNLTITVTGENLGSDGGGVLVGGWPCTDVTHIAMSPNEVLTCLLPPGEGLDQPVFVFNGFMSEEPFFIHYGSD